MVNLKYFTNFFRSLGVIDNGMITEQTTIMNADGIYLAIYTALRFNLKLINIGYYQSECATLPMTEVRHTGCLALSCSVHIHNGILV